MGEVRLEIKNIPHQDINFPISALSIKFSFSPFDHNPILHRIMVWCWSKSYTFAYPIVIIDIFGYSLYRESKLMCCLAL